MTEERRIGGFVIEQELAEGQGGMSTLYRARGPSGQSVVLKVTLERYYPQLEQEAQVLSSLSHENVVRLLPVQRGNQQRLIDREYLGGEPKCYVVLPYMAGGDLQTWRQRRGNSLSLQQIGYILGRVARALDYIHARGLVHLDVKPSNILLSLDGRDVVLSDFGTVRNIKEQDAPSRRRQPRFATPEYVSPEYAAGDRVDHRADVYSLGVVLFELLAGQVPFRATTTQRTLALHREAPVPIDALAMFPDTVRRVVARALSKNPQDRYPSAGAMMREFDACIRGRLLRWIAPGGGVAAVVILALVVLSRASSDGGGKVEVTSSTPAAVATAVSTPPPTVVSGATVAEATPTLAPTPTLVPTATPTLTPTPTYTPLPPAATPTTTIAPTKTPAE